MTNTYQPNNTHKLIPPSSSTLLLQIQAAEAKLEGSREQARLRKEAAEEAAYARGWEAEVKSRYYRSIQLGAGK